MTCTKRSYNTPQEARCAMAQVNRKGHNVERIYWCRECKAYHLSSVKHRQWMKTRTHNRYQVGA